MEDTAYLVTIATLAKLENLNLSVEEENLAAIPFAVLERRTGKLISKLEFHGTKTLPDGTLLKVTWQVQGNPELGLPTEQDLDILVALGVLTFRNNFAKTVVFQGREIARILGMNGVHGKFYQRLKVAMDRFIPLRFRALAESERHEDVNWVNVFQEASFMLDRQTGRCVGSVTWTDKIIQTMDAGFFRVINASTYMLLSGITAKHLYRFLGVEFERTDMLLIDARVLAREKLGILNMPCYLSRLLQTLEPAFEQLAEQRILRSWTVINRDEWMLALHRHPDYVPERYGLLSQPPPRQAPKQSQADCVRVLEESGFAPALFATAAQDPERFQILERCADILTQLQVNDVTPAVSQKLFLPVFDNSLTAQEVEELLDWAEIALVISEQKCRSGQELKNKAGWIVKVIKDTESRSKLVPAGSVANLRASFRRREESIRRRAAQDEQMQVVLEYEQFREKEGLRILESMSDDRRRALRAEKLETLRHQDRFRQLSADVLREEADQLLLQEIMRKQVVSCDKWQLRRKVRQTVLSLSDGIEV
jgi:hypothetical protein